MSDCKIQNDATTGQTHIFGPQGSSILANDTHEFSNATINGRLLTDILSEISERLLIIHPDPAKLEKYEALRLAYEHYKLTEALLRD